MPDGTILCPTCGSVSLAKFIRHGVELDVCPSCRGIWFDMGELASFLEKAVANDARIPEDRVTVEKRPTQKMSDVKEAVRQCPNGHGAMKKHIYGYDSGVMYDRCPECDGIWTDKKEAWNMAIYLKSNPTLRKFGEALGSALDERESTKMLGGAAKELSAHSGLLGLLPKLVFPLRDDTVTQRMPLMTILVMIACFAMTIVGSTFMKLAGHDAGFAQFYGLVPARLEWYQFLTATFLHAGVFHLAGNLYLLWVFADNVEDKLGRGKFVGFLLLGGLIGWVVYALSYSDSTLPALGSGPALAAIIGSYFVFFPHAKLSIGGTLKAIPLTAWIVLGVWLLVSGIYWVLYRNDQIVSVPIVAEVASFLGGFAAAWLIRTRRVALSG